MFNPPHPGEILRDLYLKPLALSISHTAKSIGVTRKTLSFLVNGKSDMSPAMAIRLSVAFSNSNPEYWLNLQQQYDLWKNKTKVDVSQIEILFSYNGFNQLANSHL